MVFSPPRFYSRNLSTPWSLSLPMHSSSIEILCDCFQYLQDRWQELRDRLNELLEEGDTLFNPSAHDRLLWDDENFTRSRKYFWAIHCLTEFELSIGDNILQWENYYNARIEPLRQANILTDIDVSTIQKLEATCTTLKTTRQYFPEKLTFTKVLRDGLYNASAVVESRASTRLGEIVKLLTLVSIFFLPLAFRMSLWSINNMFPATTLIYTTIIVGLSTYLIVFNLNNLVLHVSKLYQSFRDQLIGRMKHKDDKDWGFWSDEGARFDVFKPQHDQAHPSEWWRFIFVFYLLLKHIKSVALPLKAKDDDEVETSSASSVCSSVSSDFSRFSANSRTSSAKSAPQGFQHVPAEGHERVAANNLKSSEPSAPIQPSELKVTKCQASVGATQTPLKTNSLKEGNAASLTQSDAPQTPKTDGIVSRNAISKLFRSKDKKDATGVSGIV